ncbi:unnamed protein product [Gadus morhua 'NCC']
MAPSREPWIENMIINHGTEKEKNIANLKARVIAVGKMTNSQALGVQGPPQLLFLSDGVVQIPAILTDTAWENLQEDEERECFSSLVNTTVCLQTYSLQFYMAPEKRKSKFFLSLSNLAATAAGPIKEGPPCCTTLSSVRLKISDTWKALQHQNLAQTEISQSAIDLTQLLGVWQEDCLMDLVAEVRERLTAARRTTSQQPSTSRDPPARPLGIHVRTEWDLDRVRCKGAETFSIPMAHLIIPDRAALSLRPPTQPGEGSTQQSGLIPPSGDPPVLHSTPAAKPKASSSRPRAEPQDVVRGCGFEKTPPPPRGNCHNDGEGVLLEEVDADQSNPWNMFPPPSKVFCTSSSSETSPGTKPSPCQEARPDPAVHLQAQWEKRALTRNRAPQVGPDGDVSPTLEPSKGDQSLITPYQKPASPHSPTASTSSPADCGDLAEHSAIQPSGGKSPGPVEDHHPPPPGPAGVAEQGGVPCVDLSPPSWLFESHPGPVPEPRRSSQQGRVAGGGTYSPVVHGDGSSFSYRYKVSVKTVMDLSRFRVADDHLNWAVKYLVVPRHTDINNM